MGEKAGYDVAVVGGGAAGCVVAARLSEDEACRVLLLEAGPDHRAPMPADVQNGWRPTTGHDWGYVAEPDAAGVVRPLPRGKLLGGCSSTNATFALRGHPADYDAWAQAGNDGWSFEAVLPFFTRLENDADFGAAAWHGDDGPLPIRRYRDGELTDVAQAGLKALEQAREFAQVEVFPNRNVARHPSRNCDLSGRLRHASIALILHVIIMPRGGGKVLEAAFVAWLVALLGDHAVGGLTRVLLGGPERRRFAAAMAAATRVTVASVIQCAPTAARDALAAALTERFTQPPARVLDGRTRVRTALVTAIQDQISPLADPARTDSGRSFLQEIGVDAVLLRDNLADVAIRSIEQVGPEFPALTPLVTQLNADGIIELSEAIAAKVDGILLAIERLQPPAATAGPSPGFPVDTTDRIVNALLKIPSMYDTDARNVILNMLPAQIRDAIPRSPLPRVQVYNIVRTCPNYENGLRDLVRAIRSVEGDSLSMRELDAFILTVGDAPDGREADTRPARIGFDEHA